VTSGRTNRGGHSHRNAREVTETVSCASWRDLSSPARRCPAFTPPLAGQERRGQSIAAAARAIRRLADHQPFKVGIIGNGLQRSATESIGSPSLRSSDRPMGRLCGGLLVGRRNRLLHSSYTAKPRKRTDWIGRAALFSGAISAVTTTRSC
jgi:hypothetical protein